MVAVFETLFQTLVIRPGLLTHVLWHWWAASMQLLKQSQSSYDTEM